MWCCEVDPRQMYGCADYEPAEDEAIISQTNDTVLLHCVQGSNIGMTLVLNCLNGQWTTRDGRRPDCTNGFVSTSAGSGLKSSTGLDTKGTTYKL